jgi:alpha-L-fucosidase
MKKLFLTQILIAVTIISTFSQSYEVDQYPILHLKEWQQMNQSKQETEAWFKDVKFGMFIHWGLYSIPAGIWKGKKIHEMRPPHVSEWIMHAAEIPREEYSPLAKQFNPTAFNADEIAKLAKDAGMKYLVITSKHHDGFALFDSKVSEYDVMDASPFKRDIIKELHAACKKQGLEFGVYYSHNIDWQDGSDAQSELSSQLNPDISEFEKTFGANTWDPSPNSFEDYLTGKAIPQVKELMEQYPDMKLLWYDMPYRMNSEQSFKFYKTVYDRQPQILINERIGNGFGDFNITGDNTIPISFEHLKKPWETVGTFNNSWGFNSYDNDWKSPEEVLYWLVEIVSKGGNYMLNIGPKANGEVPEESTDCLKEIGKWLAINGEAIYGTRRWKTTREGPTNLNFKSTEDRAEKGFRNVFTPDDFWFTQNDSHVFVIALKYPEYKVLIESLSKETVGEIKSVKMLGSQSKIQWEQSNEGLQVTIGENVADKKGYVLKIEF